MSLWPDKPKEISAEEQQLARQVIHVNNALLGSAAAFEVLVDDTRVDIVSAPDCEVAGMLQTRVMDEKLRTGKSSREIKGNRLTLPVLKGIRSALFNQMDIIAQEAWRSR